MKLKKTYNTRISLAGTIARACLLGAMPLLSLSTSSTMATPSLVVSVNDQASGYANEGMHVRPGPRPGGISVLDLAATPVRAWHIDGIPCSVIGPPSPAAISADGREILIAASMQPDPANPGKLLPDPRVTRLRLGAAGLERLGDIEAGAQASGLRLSKDATRAWVALRGEGGIALLHLEHDKMRVAKKWTFATADDSLADIAISPDERTAFATLHNTRTLLVFDVDAAGALSQRQRVPMPEHPYHIAFFPDGKRVLVGCTTDADVMCLLEKTSGGEWRIRENIPTGRIPEGVFISPDGRWVAATCFDGANICNPQNPWFGRPARLYIYAVQPNGELSQTQALKLDGVPQGAAFSADSRRLVATQFGPGNLAVFALEDGQWRPTGEFIEMPGQPAAMSMPAK